jgi:nucleotide-binding universal stress UspA family protein
MYKDILLAVDLGDETSWRKALPTAVDLCRASGATLHVITVVPDFGMTIVAEFFPSDFEKKALAQADERLRAFLAENAPGIKAQCIVGHGTVYEEILRVADDVRCDLIVIAAHRPALKDYLLGPNAARVVRHAQCSVLVVRD